MQARPTGVVTFLFTDIEGSLGLAQNDSVGPPAFLARQYANPHAAQKPTLAGSSLALSLRPHWDREVAVRPATLGEAEEAKVELSV